MLKLLNFSCSRCSFPSDHSDHFLVNINIMGVQDEIWLEFRFFSVAKRGELYEKARTRGIDGTVDWARAGSLRIWRYTNFLDNPD